MLEVTFLAAPDPEADAEADAEAEAEADPEADPEAESEADAGRAERTGCVGLACLPWRERTAPAPPRGQRGHAWAPSRFFRWGVTSTQELEEHLHRRNRTARGDDRTIAG